MNLKKAIKKLKKLNLEYLNKMKYITYYRKKSINENIILLEAQNSNNFNGNVYYIAKELNNNEEYNKYKIYFSICKKQYKAAKEFFKNKELNNIKLVNARTKKYYKLLATAKYLVTDTSFTPCFIKKEGQVIFNTWHRNSIKNIGKKSK